MSKVEDQPTSELPAAPPAPPPAPPPPDDVYFAPPPQSQPQTAQAPPGPISVRRWIVVGVLIVAALLAGFVVYELWFSGLLESRRQAALLSQFKKSLVFDDTPRLIVPSEGDPIGVLQIPRTGTNQVVVQGIGSNDTKSGPGHDPSTPAPGQVGNAVIVGRRTTYGAPFAGLDQMRVGDSIYATTRQGAFLYTVEHTGTAPLGDPAVAAATHDNRLTLITADPAYRPQREIVVVAALQAPEGIRVPALLPVPPAGNQPGKSTDLGGAWGLMLLWGQLFLAALAGTVYLYRRRWNTAVTYLLTTPLLIALAILFYGSVDSLLPPSL